MGNRNANGAVLEDFNAMNTSCGPGRGELEMDTNASNPAPWPLDVCWAPQSKMSDCQTLWSSLMTPYQQKKLDNLTSVMMPFPNFE